MASCICRRLSAKLSSLDRTLVQIGKRTLLSEAYFCKEEWKKRLDSKVLKMVDPDEFSIMVNDKIEKTGAASAIDIDILANKLEFIDPIKINFAQDIIYRFRHTNESLKMSDSTPYALIRAFLDRGAIDNLLSILNNKVDYGIFLDYFTANILLDYFIEKKKYKEAAGIAYDLMLQEDFGHPINKSLSWLACHKHWRNPVPVEEPEAEGEVEDEEEDWVKVRFIQKPCFDDHFDLTRDSQLLGKTFTMLSKDCEDLVGRSYQLIGLGMHEKLESGLDLLQEWSNSSQNNRVTLEAMEQFQSSLESVETREVPTEEKDPGLVTLEDITPYYTQEQKEDFITHFQELSAKMSGTNKVVQEFDMEAELLTRVLEAIRKQEKTDIAQQGQLFQQWTVQRQKQLDEQIKTFQIKLKKKALAKRLRALQETEEKLSYFDQWKEINISQMRRPKAPPITNVAEEELYVDTPQERGKPV